MKEEDCDWEMCTCEYRKQTLAYDSVSTRILTSRGQPLRIISGQVIVTLCFTPSQPVQLYQGESGEQKSQ